MLRPLARNIGRIRYQWRAVTNIPGFGVYPHDQSRHEHDFVIEPSDRPGSEVDVNWSLQEDSIGVTSEAFYNMENALLKTHVGSSFSGKSTLLNHPVVFGKSKIDEAGDSVSFEDYAVRDKLVRAHLTWQTTFIEDASVGSHDSCLVGVRLVSDDASWIAVARNLLFPMPYRSEVNHHARFEGWNLTGKSPEAPTNFTRWNEPLQRFDLVTDVEPRRGHWPIVAYIGTKIGEEMSKEYKKLNSSQYPEDYDTNALSFLSNPSNQVNSTIQFVQSVSNKLVGANILVSGKLFSQESLISSIGHAASVYLNELPHLIVAKNCTAVYNQYTTAVVFHETDSTEFDGLALKSGQLYAPSHVIISFDANCTGLASMWNGMIAHNDQISSNNDNPVILDSNRRGMKSISPENLLQFPKHFIFVKNKSSTDSTALNVEKTLTEYWSRHCAVDDSAKTLPKLLNLIKGKSVVFHLAPNAAGAHQLLSTLN